MKSWRNLIGSSRPEQDRQRPSPRALRPDSGHSLRLRLLLYVGLALLPPAILIVVQGIRSAERDAADRREQLIATAHDAAAPAENIFAAAKQVALALSNVPEIRQAGATCGDVLAGVLRGLSSFRNISRSNAKAVVVCSALPGAVGRSSGGPMWDAAKTGSNFIVSGITQSPVLNRPVIFGELPLHDARGRFEGTINIVIDVRWLNTLLKASRLPAGSVAAIFDRSGHMIAASDPQRAAVLFAHPTLPADRATQVFSVADGKNQDWNYTSTPLLGDSVYVVFARPVGMLLDRRSVRVAIDLILPVLMIVLTWLTIWIVTERQLTRWILYLTRIAAAYRSGHYALRPALANAPSEMALLGDAMAQMAASIQDRDRSLREAVAQKTLLIREIHHRVKNNLQIVMSLLSLQAGRLRDPAAHETLRQTRARINALALVHRILYEIDDERAVDVKLLLEQLAEQTGEGFGADRRAVRVIVEAMPCAVPSEFAVPLALLTVEALTNAFKHAFPGGRSGTVRVVMEQAADHTLRLAIKDDGVGFGWNDSNASIGARLIATLGRQVGGSTSVHSDPGRGTTVEITFPDSFATTEAHAAS